MDRPLARPLDRPLPTGGLALPLALSLLSGGLALLLGGCSGTPFGERLAGSFSSPPTTAPTTAPSTAPTTNSYRIGCCE